MSREEIEARRESRRQVQQKAKADQETIDLDAIDKLESASGEVLHTMIVADGRFEPGVPVRIAYCAPTAAQYKRYADMVGRAQAKNDPIERRKHQEILAECCLVYPPKDSPERKAMLEAYPGLLISLSIEAAKIAELRAEDEGK